MDPQDETLEVLVVVAFPDVATPTAEQVLGGIIVKAVSDSVQANTTIDTIAVRRLDFEDCKWVYELGMPLPDYYDVTVFPDGRWEPTTNLYEDGQLVGGDDLQSLFDYLVEKGKIKK